MENIYIKKMVVRFNSVWKHVLKDIMLKVISVNSVEIFVEPVITRIIAFYVKRIA